MDVGDHIDPTSWNSNALHSCCQFPGTVPSITSENTLCLRCGLLLCCSEFIPTMATFTSIISAFLYFANCVSLVFTEHTVQTKSKTETIISKHKSSH